MTSKSIDVEWDWDPKPPDRVWYRHRDSGQRGWMVRRDGKDRIKLDRPDEDLHFPPGALWIPDVEHRPLTRMHVAQVCFEADKRLSYFLGKPENLRKEWLNLHEDTRISWMNDGPDDPQRPLRRELWLAIQALLKEHSK